MTATRREQVQAEKLDAILRVLEILSRDPSLDHRVREDMRKEIRRGLAAGNGAGLLMTPRDVLARTAAPAAFASEGTRRDSEHFARRRAEALALADRQLVALAEIGINLEEGQT